ncbi:MAG: alpha/beta fold hydrolase [Pseudonocardia sp.]
MITSTDAARDAADAIAHLVRHHAATSARSLAELTRAALAVPVVTPLDAATRSLRWWGAVLDRREPRYHLPHTTAFRTPFAHLLDFSQGATDDVVPTLVLPPQAGHSSTVVDFSPAQSQLAVIRDAGLTRAFVLDWRPATRATRHVTITDYLRVVDQAVSHLGGRANVVGDCQGGWLAAIYAALHPDRVHTLTLAGAPIDFHAGDSVIAASTRALHGTLGMAPYRALVACNGGNMSGRAVLGNFIGIQPQAEIARQLRLLENIGDPAHVERYRAFEDWFKYTQDIPGAFYLWLVEHLFARNELISGDLMVDGRRADLANVTCPLFLLAGAADHITPPVQLFAAANAVGTPPEHVTRRVADGGHLGLFMGRTALREDWTVLMAAVQKLSTPGREPVPMAS